MEKYTDYLRCGEIYKSPSQSDKTPYILKCFRCSDVFLLLESFIFHIEDYCQKEDPSTSTAVATIKSEPVDAGQTFSIEMIEENYSRHDAVECKEEKYSIREIEEDVVCIENDVDCEIIEDSAIEIKNEPVVDSDEVCGDAVDVYISDVFDDSNDDQNEVEHSGDEEVQGFGFQSLAEDTESADEDPISQEGEAISDESPISPFILNFMESPTNVLTFITTYKTQPKLWNKRLYPFLEVEYQRSLVTFTKVLNEQLKLGIPTKIVQEMISYLQRAYKEDLKCLRNNTDGKKYKPSWYFEYLRFLKPFVESNIFANLDKSLPPMIPEQIIDIIDIYKTFPHLWDSSFVEYCCQNKRSESEVLMLRTIQFRMNLKLTQHMLRKYLRGIHSYFVRTKLKHLENDTAVPDEPTIDDEPNYYRHLMYLYDHVGPFKCPDCRELLKSPFSMKTHIAKHNGSTPLTCSVCNKGFKTIGPYVSHARRHMEDFHEQCKVCGVKFLTVSELASHMVYHSNAKCYICEICGSAFNSIHVFENHKRSHGERPQYKCELCTKVFRFKVNLDKHIQTHRSNGSSHLCKTCGKLFTNPKALLVHETLHSDFGRYDCRKCKKVFKTKLSFDQHMKTHGVQTNN